jgi:hypothetical protein
MMKSLYTKNKVNEHRARPDTHFVKDIFQGFEVHYFTCRPLTVVKNY